MNTFTHNASIRTQIPADKFGRAIAQALDAETLPHDISERLRVARQNAMANRKKEFAFAAALASNRANADGSLTLGGNDSDSPSWLQWLGAAIPAIALVVGLAFIQSMHEDDRVAEIAQIDAELLADDLPPAAYADPGFAQFIKNQQSTN
jgi:hypothetical protein